MATNSPVGQALVDFSVDGLFPEEDVSSIALGPERLPGALLALAGAKAKLEVCCPLLRLYGTGRS